MELNMFFGGTMADFTCNTQDTAFALVLIRRTRDMMDPCAVHSMQRTVSNRPKSPPLLGSKWLHPVSLVEYSQAKGNSRMCPSACQVR